MGVMVSFRWNGSLASLPALQARPELATTAWLLDVAVRPPAGAGRRHGRPSRRKETGVLTDVDQFEGTVSIGARNAYRSSATRVSASLSPTVTVAVVDEAPVVKLTHFLTGDAVVNVADAVPGDPPYPLTVTGDEPPPTSGRSLRRHTSCSGSSPPTVWTAVPVVAAMLAFCPAGARRVAPVLYVQPRSDRSTSPLMKVPEWTVYLKTLVCPPNVTTMSTMPVRPGRGVSASAWRVPEPTTAMASSGTR